MFRHLLFIFGRCWGLDSCFLDCPHCKGWCAYLKGHTGSHRCGGCGNDFS